MTDRPARGDELREALEFLREQADTWLRLATNEPKMREDTPLKDGTTIGDWVRLARVLATADPTPCLDVERLYDAHTEVEAGYIQAPDRHSKAYWRKVALAYDKPGHHASQSARLRTVPYQPDPQKENRP